MVDAAGLTYRELERRTSVPRTGGAAPAFYSKSQWARWLNGQAMPPRRALRQLAGLLAADELAGDVPGGAQAGERLLTQWEACAAADPAAVAAPPSAAGQPGPPRQVPAATPHFTGRSAELSVLDELAGQAVASRGAWPPAAGGGVTSVVVIAGTAGVGKTTLANYFCQRAAARFPDGQLHVDLRGFDPGGQPLDASVALRGFLEALGVKPASVPSDADASAALYRTLVAGRSLLIAVDNARGVEQVRPLIPGSPGCLVVVTSRNSLAGLVAQGAQVLTLTPFSDDDALRFLARRLGALRLEREPRAAADLVKLCASLPLAMSVAAAYAAAHPGFPLSALAAELRSRGLDQLDTGDPETSARTVFSWSYHALSESAQLVFRLLGLDPGPDIGSEATASLAALPVPRAHAALRELSRAHLAQEHAPSRFAVHDLLRAYAAELAAEVDGEASVRAAELRLLDHYLHSGHAAASLLAPSRDGRFLPGAADGVVVVTQAAADTAMSWFTAESAPLLAACARAAERHLAPHNWQLPWIVAPYLIGRGHWVDFEATQRTALEAARRDGDARGLGHAHHHLAYALDLLGDAPAAEPHLHAALDAFARTGDDLGRGLALHGLAQVLQAQGRVAEALPAAREALRLRTEHGSAAAAASSHNALGVICGKLGLHDEAIEHCERALRICDEAGIGMYRGEALYNLGHAHLHTGDPDRAARGFEGAAAAFRETGEMPFLAATFISLADAREATGDTAGAVQGRAEAEAILGAMPDPDAEQVRAWIARETGTRAGAPGPA